MSTASTTVPCGIEAFGARPVVHLGPVDDARDEALMAAYVDGDPSAFRVLYERHGARILGLARRRGLPDDDARDLVQQTFLKLHVARRDFRVGSLLRPWLYTIALNLLRERGRAARVRRHEAYEDGVHSAGDDPGRALEAAEARRRVQDALAELPEAQRAVIELHWLEELPYAEVAAILGCSEGAARVRAHRGYERLAARLGDGSQGGPTR